MLYRYLTTGFLHGTMVGISLSVGTTLSDFSKGSAFLKVGLGVTVGLVLAGFVSFQEIQRTALAVRDRSPREKYTTLFRQFSDHPEEATRSETVAALSPLSAMALVILPFTLQGVLLTPALATILAVVLGVALLFVFGAWLGVVTRRRWYVVGGRLAAYGLLAAGVNLVLP